MIDILHDNWLLLLIGQYPHGPLGGLAMTLIISVLSLLGTIPVAVALALAMTSGRRWLCWPATSLVQVMRGIPFLMLIFWAYYALPQLFHADPPPVLTLILCLIVYKAAYVAEILRGGILSLPKGQFEASHALGLGYGTRTFRIVLPQVVFNTLPSMVTQFIGVVKDTSIGYIIGANELTFAANQLNAALFTKPFEVLLLAAAVYFVINYALASFARFLEKTLQRNRHRASIRTPLAGSTP